MCAFCFGKCSHSHRDIYHDERIHSVWGTIPPLHALPKYVHVALEIWYLSYSMSLIVPLLVRVSPYIRPTGTYVHSYISLVASGEPSSRNIFDTVNDVMPFHKIKNIIHVFG